MKESRITTDRKQGLPRIKKWGWILGVGVILGLASNGYCLMGNFLRGMTYPEGFNLPLLRGTEQEPEVRRTPIYLTPQAKPQEPAPERKGPFLIYPWPHTPISFEPSEEDIDGLEELTPEEKAKVKEFIRRKEQIENEYKGEITPIETRISELNKIIENIKDIRATERDEKLKELDKKYTEALDKVKGNKEEIERISKEYDRAKEQIKNDYNKKVEEETKPFEEEKTSLMSERDKLNEGKVEKIAKLEEELGVRIRGGWREDARTSEKCQMVDCFYEVRGAKGVILIRGEDGWWRRVDVGVYYEGGEYQKRLIGTRTPEEAAQKFREMGYGLEGRFDRLKKEFDAYMKNPGDYRLNKPEELISLLQTLDEEISQSKVKNEELTKIRVEISYMISVLEPYRDRFPYRKGYPYPLER